MKNILASGLAVFFLFNSVEAESALGTWITQPDDGAYAYIEMEKCGENICGTVARTFDENGETQSDEIGKTVVIDMVPQGDGKYIGKVWRPSNNKLYYGKMNIDGDSMALRGCIAGGLICSKQTWVRSE